MATPLSTLSGRIKKKSEQLARGGNGDEPSVSEHEGGGAKDEESCSTSTSQITEQRQRTLSQLWVAIMAETLGAGLPLTLCLQEGGGVR